MEGQSAEVERKRTEDVDSGVSSFEEMLLPPHITSALYAAGFRRPSPVQHQAIPLARLGADLVVQAKSGTGKTLVYAITTLERIDAETLTPQAVIVAPTREIALQSAHVINRLIQGLDQPLLKCACFIGGQPTADDEKRLRRACQVVVGTPGRLCALVESGRLLLSTMQLVVLDEADQLLGDSFREDIEWLHEQLVTDGVQTLALSATYTGEMLALLDSWMSEPQHVMLCGDTVSLKGVKHFYAVVGTGGEGGEPHALGEGESSSTEAGDKVAALLPRLERLLDLLGSMTFHQAVVFCNRREHGEWLAGKLTAAAFPAAHISGSRPQEERTSAMDAVRGFKRRVLVSTDLTARGVDLEHVNLVINLDLPYEAATLLHRIGRTGRWGTFGVAVTYCTNEEELKQLRQYISEAGGEDPEPLPDTISPELYMYELATEGERKDFEALLEAPVLPDQDDAPLLQGPEDDAEVSSARQPPEGDTEGGRWHEQGHLGHWHHQQQESYWQDGRGSAEQPNWSPYYQDANLHSYWPHHMQPSHQHNHDKGTRAARLPPKRSGGANVDECGIGQTEAAGLSPGGDVEVEDGGLPSYASWEEYLQDYEKYAEEHRRWVWNYYEWREQYRQWAYSYHMAAAQQVAATP